MNNKLHFFLKNNQYDYVETSDKCSFLNINRKLLIKTCARELSKFTY